MKDIVFCASMMCANFGNLEKEINDLETAGIDIFHLDLMDGSFVPNFGIGLQDVEYIVKKSTKLVDIHLMIDNPGDYIDLFANIGVDIIYIHPEADKHPARTLQKIRNLNKKAGIAINPGTSFETIEPLLNIVDYVLVMTVNPGFAGQKYLSFVESKIKKLIDSKDNYQYEVLIDGACSPEVIAHNYKLGVKGFILGTSALFGKDKGYKELLDNLKTISKG